MLTTRFTTETYLENLRYRETNNIICVYSASLPISDKLPFKDYYVLEMNNSINKIMGIGIISKSLQPVNKIYTNNYYNRYTYKGKQHVKFYDLTSGSLLSQENEKLILTIEKKIFYGKGHLKRGSSKTSFPLYPHEYIDDLINIFNKCT